MKVGERCPNCDRGFHDGSTDFGNGLLLNPLPGGAIECKVWNPTTRAFTALEGVLSRAELQHFLDVAYGRSYKD